VPSLDRAAAEGDDLAAPLNVGNQGLDVIRPGRQSSPDLRQAVEALGGQT
jgi:hypothetical protein